MDNYKIETTDATVTVTKPAPDEQVFSGTQEDFGNLVLHYQNQVAFEQSQSDDALARMKDWQDKLDELNALLPQVTAAFPIEPTPVEEPPITPAPTEPASQ